MNGAGCCAREEAARVEQLAVLLEKAVDPTKLADRPNSFGSSTVSGRDGAARAHSFGPYLALASRPCRVLYVPYSIISNTRCLYD